MQASLTYIRKELNAHFPPEEVESFIRIIFDHLKDYNSTDLIIKRGELLTAGEKSQIQEIIDRLKQNEPIQYILGVTEFYELPFHVSPDVLIPRPETEELVDWVMKTKLPSHPVILDVGTGSGCIPISIKKNKDSADIWAFDISKASLEMAKKNAQLNHAKIQFHHVDILNPILPEQFPRIDVLISNPPYVTDAEKGLMNKNVLDFEPDNALFVPDNDPLRFYKALTFFGRKHLNEGGFIFWEINEAFGKECVLVLKENGFSNVELRKDLSGKDRMVKAIKAS